jgi:hypothetical protein
MKKIMLLYSWSSPRARSWIFQNLRIRFPLYLMIFIECASNALMEVVPEFRDGCLQPCIDSSQATPWWEFLRMLRDWEVDGVKPCSKLPRYGISVELTLNGVVCDKQLWGKNEIHSPNFISYMVLGDCNLTHY